MAGFPLPPGPVSPEGTLLTEIHVNLLECKVCFEKYNFSMKDRQPQNLFCGHVLCRQCVRTLAHPILRKLECPFCRQLCHVDTTSHCRALRDLQELLHCHTLKSSVPHHQAGVARGCPRGACSGAPRLCLAFGGWGSLVNPTGLAVFTSSGTMVVVHDGDLRVALFDPLGRRLHGFGRKGRDPGEVCYPAGVAVTPCGYVVVTDAGDGALKVFSSTGGFVLAVRDSFQTPWGVDVDNGGNILVTDVQAGTLSRLVTDFAGGGTLQW
ncbi:hypothetical protein DPEC_G00140270 [Dallia pectoralis]|uniref:Uncharacterized protein n=1 Tax=Dallia pectoralis TaxID=75939 RepID=A0ACC2GMY0_DALPE|nr:hypothetical protein DPEC_G00140270 [Dallia pectoralis]